MKYKFVQTDWSNDRPPKLVFLSPWFVCLSVNDFQWVEDSGDVSANQHANSNMGPVVDSISNNLSAITKVALENLFLGPIFQERGQ